jgi:lactoylglutathione lyase
VVAACHHPILFGAILTKTVAADATQKKTRREQHLAKAIHSMIRVLDETRSVDFYRNAFGLGIADRMDFETFTLVYLRNAQADFELELTVNKGRDKPYDLGDGYGHIAFCVDDLDAEHARFSGLKFKPRDIVEFKRDGALLARFFFVEDPDGYKIEVLQRHGRYR